MPTVSDAVSEYLINQAAQGAAESTLKWYTSILSAFARRFESVALESLDAATIRRYLVELRESGLYEAAPQKPQQDGKKSRATTARLLFRYLQTRDALQVSHERLIVSASTGEPLTASGLHQALKRLKKRANVAGRVNPHSFRHGFAREYLRQGGDVITLARLLGHSDVNTTAAYYAVFDDDELAMLHNKYSPIRGLNLSNV